MRQALLELWAALLAWIAHLFGVRTLPRTKIGTRRRVVIVGGGFAGVTLAHYLESSTNYSIVLFERRDFFEYTPAMLRVACDPAHMAVSHATHAELTLLTESKAARSGRFRIVQEEVSEIGRTAVRGRKTGEWTHFDYLVLAMGSDYPGHLKPEPCCHTLVSRRAHILRLNDSLAAARSITLFGGGLVGVEYAAEILDHFPDTPLIFRQREPHLLPGFPARAQQYAERWFRRHKQCTLVFNNTIHPARYEAQQEGEVVINCTGVANVPLPLPAAAALGSSTAAIDAPAADDPHVVNAASVLEESAQADGMQFATPRGRRKQLRARRGSRSALSPNGMNDATSVAAVAPASAIVPPLTPFPVHARTHLLRVTRDLRLVGHSNVFALGDVMVEDDLLERPLDRLPKVAYQAELQAWCVSENLKRMAEGRDLWRYPADVSGGCGAPSLVACSLGPRDGVVMFNAVVVTGWVSVVTKWMLERTKMAQLRGNIVGEIMWTFMEPMSLLTHRIYVGCARCFRRRKKLE